MILLPLLAAAAVQATAPQDAAITITPAVTRSGITELGRSDCHQTPQDAKGSAPQVAPAPIPVSDVQRAPASTEAVPVGTIVRPYGVRVLNLHNRPSGLDLTWRPDTNPEEGLYAPVDKQVNGCSVSTPISLPYADAPALPPERSNDYVTAVPKNLEITIPRVIPATPPKPADAPPNKN